MIEWDVLKHNFESTNSHSRLHEGHPTNHSILVYETYTLCCTDTDMDTGHGTRATRVHNNCKTEGQGDLG